MPNPLIGLDTGPVVNFERVQNALETHLALESEWRALDEMQLCINNGSLVMLTIDGCTAAPLHLPAATALAAIGERGAVVAASLLALGVPIVQGQTLLPS